jgi:hypothetical protein
MIDHKINEAIGHYKTFNNEAFMNGNNQEKKWYFLSLDSSKI